MPRRSVGYDMEQSGLDLPGDLDRKPDSFPNTPDEEIVVAASASMQQAEQAPVVQAFSVTPEISERERREEEELEYERQKEQEREAQVRLNFKRTFLKEIVIYRVATVLDKVVECTGIKNSKSEKSLKIYKVREFSAFSFV